jgi:hypothetical protein
MKSYLLATVIPLLAVCTLNAQNIAGDWQGTLRVRGAELRLVLHVTKDDDGRLKATLDSVDQDAFGIPVTAITLNGADLNFTVLGVHGTYQGKLNPESTAIEGTWTQLEPLPVTFQRVTTPIKTEHMLAKPPDIDGV